MKNQFAWMKLCFAKVALAVVLVLSGVTGWSQTAQNLPYSYSTGKANMTSPNGWSQTGLGTDYGDATTPIKFDTTADTATLKIASAPAQLTYYLVGNGFSGGTFTVAESADGTTFTSLRTVTALTSGNVQYADAPLSSTRYLRWTYTTKSAGNVGLGTITITAAAPALTATNATIDTTFNLTFTDDAAWRAAITNITVSGITLTAGTNITAGKITFTPSAAVPAALLQTNGTRAIVIKATGYTDATVSQFLGFGAATKLGLVIQPSAPATNGSALGAQPIIAIQDQYGNTVTNSIASVGAAVGAGTWTLAGTTSKAAVLGTNTFNDLTATSPGAVTGATIAFTATGLTGLTSVTFNIPPTPPANDSPAGAIGLTVNAAAVTGLLAGATPMIGATRNDIFYSFVALGTNQTVAITNLSVAGDVDLYVYSNLPTSYSATVDLLVKGFSSLTNSETATTNKFIPGNTYYVLVQDYATNASAFELTVSSPVISLASTLAAVDTTYGNASASPTSFTASGVGLTANVTVAPPAGFEVSTNVGSGYGASLTLTPSSSVLSSTTVYVRLAAVTTVGTYSGNVTVASSGAVTKTVATVASVVDPRAITLTANAVSKTYGTGLAVTTGSSFSLTSGSYVSGAATSVTLTPDAAGLSALTAAGAAFAVTPSAATGTGGFLAANYTITYAAYSGIVSPKPLTITANNVTKSAGTALVGASGSTAFTSSGLTNAETIGSVTITYGLGAAAGDPVGVNAGQVIPSAVTGGTFTAGNYAISYVAGILTVQAVAPATAASAVNFTSVSTTNFTVNWTSGNGARRAVFLKANNIGTLTPPTDGTRYTASTSFGSGTQLGASGYYCVYDGTGNSVTVSNLSPSTAYFAAVFEYNSDALPNAGTIAYLGAAATGAQFTVGAPTVIYQHNFGTVAISGKPYTVAPTTLDSNLQTGSQWDTSASGFTEFGGNTGNALSLTSSAGTPTYTLTFTVATGFKLSLSSFSFWRQRSSSGAQNWSLTVNGTTVGSGTIPTTGADTGALTPSSTIANLTGTVTVVLALSGASSSGTFRLDDFTLNGTVTTPTILGAATASAFTTTYGTPSVSQSFFVSAANLTANLVATAPTGFELSSDGITYGTTATFAPTSGSASGTLRLRLAATATVSGTYNSQNIGLASTGATSVNITTAASGNVVNPLPVVLTGSRSYDGTATAAASLLTVSNKIGADVVTVVSGNGTLVSASGGLRAITDFDSLALSGAAVANYTLTGGSGAVRITPAAASNFTLATTKNTPANLKKIKLVLLASDAGVTLSVTAVNSPSLHGTVALNGAFITYTPVTDYVGADTFTYTLSDEVDGSTTGTVNVAVNELNVSSQITDIEILDDVATLTASGKPNQAYDVQASDNPSGPWATIGSATTAANGVLNYDDLDYPLYPSRYYRLAQQP